MHDMQHSFQDALELVRTARPGAKPNEGFMNQLQEYEHKLRLKNKWACSKIVTSQQTLKSSTRYQPVSLLIFVKV